LLNGLNENIEEVQVGLQVIMASLVTWKKSLLGDIADTRKDLHQELGLMIQAGKQQQRP
jgi:hypothetical protein